MHACAASCHFCGHKESALQNSALFQDWQLALQEPSAVMNGSQGFLPACRREPYSAPVAWGVRNFERSDAAHASCAAAIERI